ncbi:serine/threonine-protein kinase [Streptomyces cavernae]|uniref:serine/threonine-protein kinase n=1 Tax=Streptomyces cavernae TaxID=2259034 RepID=UPI001EE48A89|nr:serine/threonine-protein kinase [Streptomyces cavernae]
MIDGRFELREQLGSGGMGTVWRAHDTVLHRDVALKQVRYGDSQTADRDPERARLLRERILREARALARLSHPNVVTIHHIVDEEPFPWLVMECIRGASLQDRLDDGPLPPHETAAIGLDVLAALRAAHAAGIHHRDVKPANILLCEEDPVGRPGVTASTDTPVSKNSPVANNSPGSDSSRGSDDSPGSSGSIVSRAVLTDFGIAAVKEETRITVTGDVVGSPEFIAPELLNGDADSPAADLWSLGMTLYVAVEGVSPMRRGTALATLAAVLHDEVPPPERAGALAPVLRELLEREPEARPDATRLEHLLRTAMDGTRDGTTVLAGHPESGPRSRSTPHSRSASDSAGTAHSRRTSDSAATSDSTPATNSPAATHSGSAGRSRLPLITVAAVAAAGLAVAGSLAYVTWKSDAQSGPSSTVDAAPTVTVTASPGPGKSPSAGPESKSPSPARSKAGEAATPVAAESPKKTVTATATATAPSASGEPATASPGAVDPEAFVNRWISKLDTIWRDSGTAVRDQRLAAVRKQIPNAQVLVTDDFASMGAGYWVIYVPRAFSTGTAAVEYCVARGRTTESECVGRYLSHNSADSPYTCSPTADGQTTGRCAYP